MTYFFYKTPEDIRQKIKGTHTSVKDWIEKKGGFGLPRSIEKAKALFQEDISKYHQMLQIFMETENIRIILVPDTNALIQVPHLSRYREVAGQSECTVIITPTVLKELDDLKRDHRDVEFRSKVGSVIRVLKGLRQQGNMREGVTVDKTITVKMAGKGPDFSKTLSWLDKSNCDDQIIASAFDIQRENPSSIVILVTSDINHQNKAEMANLPYTEPPEITE